ncbi:MAG TPA: hypothetical protein VN453_03725 [Feifaniaceae bacterium]|nr:hypothetical protein [Feifaniaceae bacterium]
MSKYDPLWEQFRGKTEPRIKLAFIEIEQILGFAIDHSFLNYKKELLSFGYEVEKISLKEQTVLFRKIEG